MSQMIGKPEIPVPGAMNLPAMQAAVNNIRERFKTLEAAVALNVKTGNAALTASANDLAAQVAALRRDIDALDIPDLMSARAFSPRIEPPIKSDGIAARAFAQRQDPPAQVDQIAARAFAARPPANDCESQSMLAAQVFTRH